MSGLRLLSPFVLLSLVLAAALLLDGGDRDSDLVIVHRMDVFTLDPQRMSYQHDMRVAMALYEGLTVLDPATCQPVPGVADRWERSEDGLAWTFHLRPDARWNNGDPVRSTDFEYAWMRGVMPDFAADYAGLFFAIEGAEEFFRWRSAQLAAFAAEGADSVAASRGERAAEAERLFAEARERFRTTVGIETPDDRTLVVRLRQPVAYLLDLVAMPVMSPVHEPSLAAHLRFDPASGRVETDPGWTRPEALVSNGPYVLDEWRYKRDLRLRRNERYWNADAVACETITILPLEDNNTAVLAFDTGAVDWVTDVVVEYRADLLEQRRRYERRHAEAIEAGRRAGLDEDEILASLPPPRGGERRNVRAFDAFGTDFFSFNCRPTLADGRSNPFADARVRRAFALAIDKATLVSKVTRLGERVAGVLTPPGVPGYEPPAGLGHDPARARRELADAGWEVRNGRLRAADGTSFPTVDLLYSTGNARYEDLALALRDMWQRELGVDVELRAKEGKFYKDDLRSGNFMVARGGWYGDFGDPMTFLSLSRTGDGNNDRGYTSPRFDAMLEAAENEVDPKARLALLAEAERFLFEEEMPLVPICNYKTIYLYEPGRLRGLCTHPRLEQYLGRMWIERGRPN